MKQPSGSVRPRRSIPAKKKVRLDLKRRPQPAPPEDDLDARQKSTFWKWFAWVALLHVVIIGTLIWLYEATPAPKPPEQFISLLPPGDVVKGTPGAQKAHKVGPTTAASVVHHASPPPRPQVTHTVEPKPIAPAPVVVPPPKPIEAKPLPIKQIVKVDAPPLIEARPKPAPPKPKPPKIKVDLNLVDGPSTAVDKPKPKPHHKKPVAKSTEDPDDLDHEPALKADSQGLSKEQIAAKLGDKLDNEGEKNAPNLGVSGSQHSHASPYADFYALIKEQIDEKWVIPYGDEPSVKPVVEIHVEKDGEVPPDKVYLKESSGNAAYDSSAVETAKNLGVLHEPLPDGCPPDISIIFTPDR